MEISSISSEELAAVGMRFHRYFRRKGYSAKQVADRVGIHQNQLTSMVNGTDFHLRNLMKAVKLFPALRMDWLLLGLGEPEKKGAVTFETSNALDEYAYQYERLAPKEVPLLDKDAQGQAKALSELLDQGLLIRCSLLAQLADLQARIIESSDY